MPDHFGSGHGKSGLILVTFVVLQVVAAIFRPSKPASDSVVLDVNGERAREVEYHIIELRAFYPLP